MGKFLVAHTLPSPATIEEAGVFAKMAKANVTLDAYWIGATMQLNEQGKATKILCEWDAKDTESIRKVLAKVPGLPVDGVYPILRTSTTRMKSSAKSQFFVTRKYTSSSTVKCSLGYSNSKPDCSVFRRKRHIKTLTTVCHILES